MSSTILGSDRTGRLRPAVFAVLSAIGLATAASPACGDDRSWRGELATGAGYFGLDGVSRLGSQTAVAAFKPLSGDSAAFVYANTNQYSGGAQYGGAFGLFKAPTGTSSLRDRLGFSAAYDSYTDTRLGSPYVGSVTGDVEMLFGDRGAIPLIGGARYVRTVTGASIDAMPQAVFNNGAPGGPFSLEGLEATEIYGRTNVRGTALELGLGYLDGPNLTTYRAAIAAPLSDRVGVRFQLTGDDEDQWTGFAGVSFALGPLPTSRRRPFPIVPNRQPLLLSERPAPQDADGEVVLTAGELDSTVNHVPAPHHPPTLTTVLPPNHGPCDCAVRGKFASVVSHRLATQEFLLR
ncbi:MAG: hypothetical protein AAF907_03675, partial [Planctomycetota bacterium]